MTFKMSFINVFIFVMILTGNLSISFSYIQPTISINQFVYETDTNGFLLRVVPCHDQKIPFTEQDFKLAFPNTYAIKLFAKRPIALYSNSSSLTSEQQLELMFNGIFTFFRISYAQQSDEVIQTIFNTFSIPSELNNDFEIIITPETIYSMWNIGDHIATLNWNLSIAIKQVYDRSQTQFPTLADFVINSFRENNEWKKAIIENVRLQCQGAFTNFVVYYLNNRFSQTNDPFIIPQKINESENHLLSAQGLKQIKQKVIIKWKLVREDDINRLVPHLEVFSQNQVATNVQSLKNCFSNQFGLESYEHPAKQLIQAFKRFKLLMHNAFILKTQQFVVEVYELGLFQLFFYFHYVEYYDYELVSTFLQRYRTVRLSSIYGLAFAEHKFVTVQQLEFLFLSIFDESVLADIQNRSDWKQNTRNFVNRILYGYLSSYRLTGIVKNIQQTSDAFVQHFEWPLKKMEILPGVGKILPNKFANWKIYDQNSRTLAKEESLPRELYDYLASDLLQLLKDNVWGNPELMSGIELKLYTLFNANYRLHKTVGINHSLLMLKKKSSFTYTHLKEIVQEGEIYSLANFNLVINHFLLEPEEMINKFLSTKWHTSHNVLTGNALEIEFRIAPKTRSATIISTSATSVDKKTLESFIYSNFNDANVYNLDSISILLTYSMALNYVHYYSDEKLQSLLESNQFQTKVSRRNVVLAAFKGWFSIKPKTLNELFDPTDKNPILVSFGIKNHELYGLKL